MKTIFLAAGNSSRLFPISSKNFLEFCGEPLFLRLLRNAQEGGLSDFVVVAQNNNASEYEKILKENNFSAEVVIQSCVEDGMGGGVLAGLNIIKDDEPVFILGGNDFVESDVYKKILSTSDNFDGAILAKKVSSYFPGGYLVLDDSDRIINIKEKPKIGSEPSDLINIVAHFFKRAGDIKPVLKSIIENNSEYHFYEAALQKLFKTKKFKAVYYDGIWQSIKYPWHVLDMMNVFLNKQKNFIDPSSDISPSATIKGDNIFISKNVKIFENAVISGPCFIGESAIIGNNALIRNSIIGKNSCIGFCTEVARSFLSQSVSTHFSCIEDSVIDRDCNLGAFSVTANLRLDRNCVKVKIKGEKIDSGFEKLGAFVGSGTQVGAHAKMMPGAMIKSDSVLMPGEIYK